MRAPGGRPAALGRFNVQAASTTSVPVRAVLSTVGVSVQGVVRFLYSLLIGRVSGPAVLGEASAPVSMALFASLLWPTATGSAAAKFVAIARGGGRPEEIEGVARHLARRTVLSSLVLAVVSALGALTILHTSLATAAMTAALAIAYSGYAFTRGLQFGAGQVPRATVWDVTTAIVSLVALVLVVTSHAVWLLLVPLTIGYGVYSAMNWPRGLRATVGVELRREMDGLVLLGVIGNLSSAGFLQLSNVLARAANAPHEAGLYAAALSLATPASLISRSFSLVLFPSMSEAHGRADRASVRAQTDLGTRALVMVMVAAFGVTVILSQTVLHVLYSHSFNGADAVLPIMLIAVLLGTVDEAVVNFLTSTSQRGAKIVAAMGVLGLLVGAVAWAVLVPAYGVTGVALGYLIGSAVAMVSVMVIVWREERHDWAGLAVRFLVAVAALVACAFVEGSRSLGPLASIGVAVAFGLAWLALSYRDVRRVAPLIVRR